MNIENTKYINFIGYLQTFFHLFLYQNHNNHQNPHDLVLVFWLICLDEKGFSLNLLL